MGLRQKAIIRFYKVFEKSSGPGKMPEHISARWNGQDYKFYHQLWTKLNGDKDLYLFSDYVDAGYFLSKKNTKFINDLPKDRLNKLSQYCISMLCHYRLSSIFWKTIGFFLRFIAKPIFYVFMALYTFLRILWAIWVLFISVGIDFVSEVHQAFKQQS